MPNFSGKKLTIARILTAVSLTARLFLFPETIFADNLIFSDWGAEIANANQYDSLSNAQVIASAISAVDPISSFSATYLVDVSAITPSFAEGEVQISYAINCQITDEGSVDENDSGGLLVTYQGSGSSDAHSCDAASQGVIAQTETIPDGTSTISFALSGIAVGSVNTVIFSDFSIVIDDALPPRLGALSTAEESGGATVDLTAAESGSGLSGVWFAAGLREASEFPAAGTEVTITDGIGSFSVSSGGTYTVYAEDDRGNHSLITVAVNTYPEMSGLTDQTITEDNPLVLSFNVTDAETAPGMLSISALSSDQNIILDSSINILNTAGSISLSADPIANANGTLAMTVRVTDEGGLFREEVVTIEVTAANDVPTANADSAQTDEDTPIEIHVLANDLNPDGGVLTVAVSDDPASGTATVNPSMSVTFTPAANASGIQTFTYQITDSIGADTATADVTVTILAVNDPPSAVDDPITMDEDSSISISILANDSDIENDAFQISAYTEPSHGTVVLGSELDTFTYTPYSDYFGADQFSYTIAELGDPGQTDSGWVYLTVNNINDAPIPSYMENVNTDEDTPLNTSFTASDADADLLTFYIKSGNEADHGDVVIGTGDYTYTPDADYSGTDSFRITVSDGTVEVDSEIQVTVNGVDDAPLVIYDSAIITDEDIAAIEAFSASDPDQDPLTIVIEDGNEAQHGVVVINEGSYTYTPASNYHGVDSFTITVSDGTTDITCPITVTVNSVNDVPVPAYNANISTDEDTAITETFSAADADLDPLSFFIKAGDEPSHGSVELITGGYTYTPGANFHGEDSFIITVSDGNTEIASEINVDVHSLNDAPVPSYASNISTAEDAAVIELFSATDVDLDELSIFVASGDEAAHGDVLITTGQYTYTPDPDFSGTDNFTITVSDGTAEVDCPITVTVNAVNDTPVPVYSDSISTDEDSAIIEGFSATDVDLDELLISIQAGNEAAHGEIIIAEGQYTYSPDADFNGTDNFTITVSDGTVEVDCPITVTVNAVNDAPVPVYSASISTDEDTATTPSFTAVDVDLDVLNYSIKLGNGALHGTVTLGEGDYTYSPSENYYGADQFTITVSDGTVEVDSLVSVTVNPVNDLPMLSYSATTMTDEDQSITAPFTAADIDPDTLTFSVKPANEPESGQIILGDGEYTYTPDADFNGIDQFIITVSDGTAEVDGGITVTVNSINDAPVPEYEPAIVTNEDNPVSELFNATDVDLDTINYSVLPANGPAHGDLELISGGYTYSPDANYNGSDSFTITVSDGTVQVHSTISVTVQPVNDTPVANADSVTTIEDTPITIDVLANDSDVDIPEGDILTVSAITTASTHGNAVISDNKVVYTPFANYFGNDTFTYEITDSGGGTSTATVSISVTSINDAPIPDGLLSEYTTLEDNPITIYFNLTDVETPTETLTMQVVSGNTSIVSQNRVSISGLEDTNPAVSITINPIANRFGDVLFTLRTSDGFQTAVYTFTLHVSPVNDGPTARNDTINFLEDHPATITISSQMITNDTDIDDLQEDLLFAGIISTTSEGILTDNGDGTLTYSPTEHFDGNDTFVYRIVDPDGAGSNATVTLHAVPENDAPTISAIDDQTIDEDGSLSVLFTVDDFDLETETELNTLMITTSSTNPALLDANHMRVTGSGNDRTFTAAPLSDKNGTVTVTITVSDGIAEATESFDVVINPVPDDPIAEDDFFYVKETGSNSIDPIANDWDADEDSNLTPSIVSGPSTGSLTADGKKYIYTANSSFNETDSFTYIVTDSTGRTSAAATVELSADVSNQPPAISKILNQVIFEDDTGSVSFTVEDVNGNLETVGAVSQNLTLIPQANLALSNIGATYTLDFVPAADANGQMVIAITAEDTLGNVTTTSFSVRVVPLNDIPNANDDDVSTNEDTSVSFNVISNDTDQETTNGNLILRKVLTYPAHGNLSGLGGGQFRYTPNANFNGTDTFSYEMSDTDGGVSSATVTLTINSVNDAPEANSDNISTVVAPGGTLDNINVIGNDTDADILYDLFEKISVTRIVTQPACGRAYLNPGGLLKYEAFNGGACSANWISFTYEITDHYGSTDTATVSIAVDDISTNLEPRVSNAWRSIQEDSATITIDLASQAFDPDGDTLTFDLDLASPPNTNLGVATIAGSVVSYTPNANKNGTYTDENFIFTVFDGTTTVNGIIYVEIKAVNDTPTISMQTDSIVAIPDQSTDEDLSVIVSFYINDVDKDDIHGVMGIDDLGLSIYSDCPALIPPASISYTRNNLTGLITLTLTPVEDESGSANITVELTDSIVYTTDAFLLTVIEGNDPPIANDLWVTTYEEEPLAIDVIDNVVNVDDDAITISAGPTAPSHGSISFDQVAGKITYTPDVDYFGDDVFDFVLTDESMLTDSGTVHVTINPVNDPPDVFDLEPILGTAEDTAVSTTFKVADIDTDLADMTLSAVFSDPALVGSYTFTKSTDDSGEVTLVINPAANQSGTLDIAITASDVDKSDTENTTLTIYAINDPPVVQDDSALTNEDQSVIINVIQNDTDIEDPNTLYVVSNTTARLVSDGTPGHGTITNNNNGTLTYTPASDRNEDIYFTYELSDSGNLRDTGTVTVTINPVNDAPRAFNDSRTITEDTPVTISVLVNDYDVEGNLFGVSAFSDPPHGSVTFNSVGQSFTYTPDANYFGPDSFTYTVAEDGDPTKTGIATVNISIQAQDDYPVISTTEPWMILEDTSDIFSVTISDAETASANLLITFTSLNTTLIKSHNVILQGAGTSRTVRLTPEAQMNGSLQLRLDVNDGALTTTELIDIVIVPVNDPPVAQNYTATADEDNPASGVVVVKSDIDLLHEGDTHTYSLKEDGAHGNAIVQSDGNWDYTPDANFNGTDSFTITITDSHGATAISTVTVTVNKVNDTPLVTSSNQHTIDEDTSVTDTIVILDPDTGDTTDPDSHTLQVTTESVHGTVVLDGTSGEYTYTPDENYNGSDSFVVKVTDEHGAETSKTVQITVEPVNDAPVANADNATINEDGNVEIHVLDNDTDIDLAREGDDLTISAVSNVDHGSVVIAPDGKSLHFYADADWFGIEVFSYTVTDLANDSDQADVTITINAVNDAPVISDIANQEIAEDGTSGAISFTVTDVDNDDGSLLVTSATSNGVVIPLSRIVLGGSGSNRTVTINPAANKNTWNRLAGLHQPVTITLQVSDGSLTDSDTFTVTVTPVNDDPIPANDSRTMAEDGSIVINVLANDADVDTANEGDALTIDSIALVDHANVEIISGGSALRFTPDPDWFGIEKFNYTVIDTHGATVAAEVTVTVTPVNDAPLISAIVDQTIDEDGSTGALNFIVSDVDDDENILLVTAVTGNGIVIPSSNIILGGSGSNRTVSINPDTNQNTWNHASAEHDPVLITLTVSDGHLMDSETFTVSVIPRGDWPLSANDIATMSEDSSAVIDVLANDFDIDMSHEGDDLIIYFIADVDHALVTIAGDGKSLTFTPDAHWNGVEVFNYTVLDQYGLTSTSDVEVTVLAVNDEPNAENDSTSVNEGESVVIDVLANDSDVDISREGDDLTIVSTSGVDHGSAEISLDGKTVTFTPDGNWSGTEVFTYTITDTHNATDTASVTVSVSPVDDDPTAHDDAYTILEDAGASHFNVLINDSDADLIYGDALEIVQITVSAAHGSLVIDSVNQRIIYTPDANFNGSDSFSYQIQDDQDPAVYDSAEVAITVTSVNDLPVVTSTNSHTIQEESSASGVVTVTDADTADQPDPDSHTFSIETPPLHGSVVLDLDDGSYTYTPDEDHNGTDIFTILITDERGGSVSQNVTITIGAINDAPIVDDASYNTPENTPVSETIQVVDPDVDLNGDELSFIVISDPLNGSLILDPSSGVFTYTPDTDFNGTDSFTVEVSDLAGESDQGVISFYINYYENDPEAHDDAFSIDEDSGQASFDVMANDEDSDLPYGDVLNLYAITAAPAHGDASIDAGSNQIYYTPDPNYNGTDTFSYTIRDSQDPLVTSEATVVITVLAVNDLPLISGVTHFDIDEDMTLSGAIVFSDADFGDTPADTHTFRTDAAPLHGSIDLNNGLYTYTPAANYNGTDSFTLRVTDSKGGYDTVTITATMNWIDDDPVANEDTFTMKEGAGWKTLDVVTNDTDADLPYGDLLTITQILVPPAHGIVEINTTTNTLRYKPNGNFHGTDSFEYVIRDNQDPEVTSSAIVRVKVSEVKDEATGGNTAPPAPLPPNGAGIGFPLILLEDGQAAGGVGNGGELYMLDPNNPPLHGTVTVDPVTGEYIYVPDEDFNGEESFGILITKGGKTFSQEVKLMILPVNDSPTTANLFGEVKAGESVRMQVPADDIDVFTNTDILHYSVIEEPSTGTVVLNPETGEFTFIPLTGFIGTVTFIIRAEDTDGEYVDCLVMIEVLADDAESAPLAGFSATSNSLAKLAGIGAGAAALLLLLLFFFNVRITYLVINPDGSTRKFSRIRWVLGGRQGTVTLDIKPRRLNGEKVNENEVVLMRSFVMRFKGKTLILKRGGVEITRVTVEKNHNGRMVIPLN